MRLVRPETLVGKALKALLIVALAGLSSAPSLAQEVEPIADFEACKDAEVARFELDLQRTRSGHYSGIADHVDAGQIDVCGVNGIILCDRGDAPLPCQHDLAAKQEALRAVILMSLPTPESIIEKQGPLSEQLYPKVLALAQGSSAGPDCAGNTPVLAAWCEAREATRRVEMAVLAYQLARDHYGAASAYEQGWAQMPPPMRPKARATEEGQ